MKTIKNIHKITEFVPLDVLVLLDKGANLHLRHSNIEFKILSVEADNITIRTTQGKHMSENYAEIDKLVSLTKNLFETKILGYNIIVHPVPYIKSPVDDVTPDWINSHMRQYSIRVKDIQAATGIDKTSISAWINNKKPMSQIVKALMFNFLCVYAVKELVKVLNDPEYFGHFMIKKYFDRDLILMVLANSKSKIEFREDDKEYIFNIDNRQK